MKKRIQNKIAESRWTLPFVLGYGILIVLAEGLLSKETWMSTICVFLATLLMAEFNNRFALIRIYCRLISASFLVLTLISPQLLTSTSACIAQLAFVSFYIIFFMAYQDRNAAGLMFYSFCIAGVISLIWVQALYFVPLLWIMMATYNMAGSIKNIMGSVLGVMAPYWFISPYYIYKGNLEQLLQHFESLGKFEALADFSTLSTEQISTFCVISVLFVIGMVHFLRSSYLDKIRIRMTYNTLIVVGLAAITFLVLQPQHYDLLIRILLVSTSVLIAHFFALTHNKLTNITFVTVATVVFFLTIYNLLAA